MKFTNKHGLPDTIIRAAHVNDAKYNKGDVHRSVTQLIQPPRIDMLRKAHFSELTKDISEEWWALFGSAVHHILEMGASPETVVEERLYTEIDGWSVSGMADLQEFHPKSKAREHDAISISDYKVTTAFALTVNDGDAKDEWEAQLNLLGYLVLRNKQVVLKELAVIAIVRDWQRTQAAIDPMYPQAPVVKIKVPIWSMARQENFLKERIRLHRETEMLHDIGAPLPECSDEERWMRGHKWAITKIGGVKATRVYDTEAEANTDFASRKAGAFQIEKRPGKNVRCEGDYCQVSAWCEQFARLKEQDNAAQQT
jgi:hypothetical protein